MATLSILLSFKLKLYINIDMFSDAKNRTGMAGSGKAVSSVVQLPTFNGAIDGKHVVLQCPRNSASEYFNYKNAFNIILFALVDANYNFMFVDTGCQVTISDSGVFTNTKLYKKPETKTYVFLGLFL
jgi:hypothetical protein